MRKIYLSLLLCAFLVNAFAQPIGRKLRWTVADQATTNKTIISDNDFIAAANWRVVNSNGTVSIDQAVPSNGDTLQIFNATLNFAADFDLTFLQQVTMVLGDPRPTESATITLSKNAALLMHSTSAIQLLPGSRLRGILDDEGAVNTYIKIGEVPKLLSSNLQDVEVVGPAYANSKTPETTTILQEGFAFGILPVVLVEFDARINGKGVQVLWKTQQENNTRSFLVEKSSDGRNFRTLATVNAAGYSSTVRNYTYFDPELLSGMAYYRIRMISVDNLQGLTVTRVVRPSGSLSRTALYPNPAVDRAYLVVDNPRAQQFSVLVYSLAGQLVQQQRSLTSTNSFPIDVSKLPTADYMVKVQFNDGTSTSARLSVKH